MKNTAELLQLIELEKIDHQTYLGQISDVGSPNVYGGQLLAQSLNAAYQGCTKKDFLCNSIHTYFFSAGNLAKKTITYQVSENFIGRSFACWQVVAMQENRVICKSMVSFHKREDGLSHQFSKPFMFWPRFLTPSWEDALKLKRFLPQKIIDWLMVVRPITFKSFDSPFTLFPTSTKNLWMKFKEAQNDLTAPQKQQLILYAIDYNILFSAINAHRKAHYGNTQMASLDHSMWFHRNQYDISKWFFLAQDCPSTSNARAFTRSNVYSSKGKLIASATQEGLFRPKKQEV
ncbi:MAG: acyl-CoA thioesterase II [Flavobacteriaceae bacterium]|nr:MAG: acyl-CoA thioesterase II [Flavobacteriaceae bacterium]